MCGSTIASVSQATDTIKKRDDIKNERKKENGEKRIEEWKENCSETRGVVVSARTKKIATNLTRVKEPRVNRHW